MKVEFGDIVLLNFPYVEGQSYKRRPALILNDLNDGDIIVCRITSQNYETINDVNILYWKEIGLKLPSVIRVHKVATLQQGMIERVIGKIGHTLKNQVIEVFRNLVE